MVAPYPGAYAPGFTLCACFAGSWASCVVQSIVDADTAPAKRESYRRLLTTEIADDAETRAQQFDDNPGLWLRVHPNVRSLILADVLEI